MLATSEMQFVPEIPRHPGYLIFKLCAEIGLRPVSTPAKIGMCFLDETTVDGFEEYGILNARCVDISKHRMEEAFAKVSGYNLAIDPTMFHGSAVCKSDENAVHDGRVVQCPIKNPEPGCVYEILVDNSINDEVVEDIRVSIVGTQMPIAYLKRRWKRERFFNTNIDVEIADPSHVLSRNERELVFAMAKEIGLDFGEFDILRDRSTRKIYVVDAAKTPFGPPARLSFLQKRRAVKRIAKAFREEFISQPTRPSIGDTDLTR